MLSRPPDSPSGATRLRDCPALQVSYLSTRDRGAGQIAYDDRIDDWVGLIEHWNGTTWKIVASPGQASYNTVTALSGSDAWAAGTAGSSRLYMLAAHWSGRSWTLVKDTSDPDYETHANGSSASDPRDVWIVGQEAAGPLVERFDGHRFVRVSVPYDLWKSHYANEEPSHLYGVAAISPRSVWAVGTFGIVHYDGRNWKVVVRDELCLAITARAPTDIWAVGGQVYHYTCS
jgi:hypothetical protein